MRISWVLESMTLDLRNFVFLMTLIKIQNPHIKAGRTGSVTVAVNVRFSLSLLWGWQSGRMWSVRDYLSQLNLRSLIFTQLWGRVESVVGMWTQNVEQWESWVKMLIQFWQTPWVIFPTAYGFALIFPSTIVGTSVVTNSIYSAKKLPVMRGVIHNPWIQQSKWGHTVVNLWPWIN